MHPFFKDVDGPVGPRGCVQSKSWIKQNVLRIWFCGGPFYKNTPILTYDFHPPGHWGTPGALWVRRIKKLHKTRHIYVRGKEGNSTNPTKFLPLHFVKDKICWRHLGFELRTVMPFVLWIIGCLSSDPKTERRCLISAWRVQSDFEGDGAVDQVVFQRRHQDRLGREAPRRFSLLQVQRRKVVSPISESWINFHSQISFKASNRKTLTWDFLPSWASGFYVRAQ